jgi:hypothetical protein
MAQRKRRPLTDDDGEARTPTREEWAWFVSNADFDGDMTRVHDFLIRRAEILRAAETLGIPREVFLPFAPTKPGFEERIAAAFGPFPKAAGLAAE